MPRGKRKVELETTNVETVKSKPEKVLTPLEQLEKYGKKGKGKAELMKWLKTGKPLTRAQAMAAKCYDCVGWCEDGQFDCGDKTCPMYPYMPYGAVPKKDKPDGRGRKKLSPEHLAKLIEGRKKQAGGIKNV